MNRGDKAVRKQQGNLDLLQQYILQLFSAQHPACECYWQNDLELLSAVHLGMCSEVRTELSDLNEDKHVQKCNVPHLQN